MINKLLPIIIIFIISVPAIWFLLGPGYFNMHDDLQVMRIFQMEKCFADGQIPCRWAPDMAWGYGQAMFNYYSAFPYYLGVFIRTLSPLSIMGTVKALFMISLTSSGIGMYLLIKNIWGRLAGIVGATLYIYAPYHALDIYIRGALSESFSLAILPFLWHSIYLLIKKTDFKRIVYLVFCIGIVLSTHNISAMIYAPITVFWILYLIIKEKRLSSIKDLMLAGLLGIGLASFFILPVIFEKILIQTNFLTVDYLDYVAHFATINQLFIDRSWGHGPSIWGPEDEISFQIGWPHWWLAILSGIYITASVFRRKFDKTYILVFGLLTAGGFFAFLTHSRSTFIWMKISVMKFIQFPWRFLGLVMFFLAFAGAILARPKIKLRKFWIISLVLIIMVMNYRYFKPWNRSYNIRDDEKLTGIAFELQQKSAILDYLPVTAKDAPKGASPQNPVIIGGEGKAYNYSKRSNSFFFDAEIYSNEAEIQIPIQHFPNWVVISGGNKISSYPSGDYGVITVKLANGKHLIQGRFENTSIRNIANSITVISAVLIFVFIVLDHNRKKFLWFNK
jgi:hypothetical protein